MADPLPLTYEEAKERLLNHAVLLLERDTTLSAQDSLSHTFRRAERNKGELSLPVLDRLYNDVLACLEVVNHYINGEVPTETYERANPLDIRVALAVCEVIDEGWRYHHSWSVNEHLEKSILDHLSLILRRISCAWVWILHGDADSLSEEIGHAEPYW